MFIEEAACDATCLESILEILRRFRAACNIFLVEAPAEFRYAPVFGEKTPSLRFKQRCLFGAVNLLRLFLHRPLHFSICTQQKIVPQYIF